jgi:hypothetical protein
MIAPVQCSAIVDKPGYGCKENSSRGMSSPGQAHISPHFQSLTRTPQPSRKLVTNQVLCVLPPTTTVWMPWGLLNGLIQESAGKLSPYYIGFESLKRKRRAQARDNCISPVGCGCLFHVL